MQLVNPRPGCRHVRQLEKEVINRFDEATRRAKATLEQPHTVLWMCVCLQLPAKAMREGLKIRVW